MRTEQSHICAMRLRGATSDTGREGRRSARPRTSGKAHLGRRLHLSLYVDDRPEPAELRSSVDQRSKDNKKGVMHISNPKAVAIATVGVLAVGVPSAGAAAKHFITGKDVKNESLTSADVKNLSLHARDFDKKVQRALKVRAQRGLAGGNGRMSRSPWNFGGGLSGELSQTAAAATSGAGVSVTVCWAMSRSTA